MKKWDTKFRARLEKIIKPELFSSELMVDKESYIEQLVLVEKNIRCSCK